MVEKLKEISLDIVNNGTKYEVKKCNRECNVVDDSLYCDCEYKKWVPFKLHDKVSSNCEFRKVVEHTGD